MFHDLQFPREHGGSVTWLLAGIAVFFGVHLIPACPALRARIAGVTGERAYLGAFSILSLAGLAAMARGLQVTPPLQVWPPPQIAELTAAVLMLPAMVLIASVKFDNHIARATRNPMAWGFLLWAACHVFANGELDALLFFGAFAAYLIFFLCARGRKPREWKAPSPDWRLDALAILIGMAAYAVFAALHETLFGVPAFS